MKKSIVIDPKSSDGAAYHALAMLYFKVPAWPIAFGDNEEASPNFKKALKISSNIDTNYRYGKFLAEEDQSEGARKYLQKAYDLPNRPSHREDPLRKRRNNSHTK
ncbi:MAG: hypothetical protein IT292_05175 [Deltaproteobacteria bacterium]|nr:hypothetical protein [Deltaproteobacteria bacterium]